MCEVGLVFVSYSLFFSIVYWLITSDRSEDHQIDTPFALEQGAPSTSVHQRLPSQPLRVQKGTSI